MAVARPWAWPLVPLYWAGLRMRDGLRAAGVSHVRRLDWPVISVGSVSAGGAGKTPVVIALAELLKSAGYMVDVLSRGYRREGEGPEQVQPKTENAASRFGDEPVLIARRTGAEVWVGANRYEAGLLAENACSGRRGIHVLDDGFQHRQLARSVDIVLLTAAELDDTLLPAGNRREPLAAVSRADVVVLREDEDSLIRPLLKPFLRPGTDVWVVRRSLSVSKRMVDTKRPLVAFCGIARPDSFFEMLRREGCMLRAQLAFLDHHTYTFGDVSRIIQSCHLEDCGFVTTEKDAVKLGPELRKGFESAGGLFIARLETVFLRPEQVTRTLQGRLG